MNTSSPRRTNPRGVASTSGVPRFLLNCSTRHRRRREPRLSLMYSPFSARARSAGAYEGSRNCTAIRWVHKLTSCHSQSPSARTRALWRCYLRDLNAPTTLGPHARTFPSSSATVAPAYSFSLGAFWSAPRSLPTSTSEPIEMGLSGSSVGEYGTAPQNCQLAPPSTATPPQEPSGTNSSSTISNGGHSPTPYDYWKPSPPMYISPGQSSPESPRHSNGQWEFIRLAFGCCMDGFWRPVTAQPVASTPFWPFSALPEND